MEVAVLGAVFFSIYRAALQYYLSPRPDKIEIQNN